MDESTCVSLIYLASLFIDKITLFYRVDAAA